MSVAPNELPSIPALFKQAFEAELSRSSREVVDWSEAQKLVLACSTIPDSDLERMPGVRSMLAYARDNDEWDSGVVANWLNDLCRDLAPQGAEYGLLVQALAERYIPSAEVSAEFIDQAHADGLSVFEAARSWLDDEDFELP